MKMKININRFYKNITDQITEAHLKLGKARETIRLYYPLSSVNAYLDSSFSTLTELFDMLINSQNNDSKSSLISCDYSFPEELQYKIHDDRLEVIVSPANTGYIDENFEPTSFLKELINLFSASYHDLTLKDVRALFCSFASPDDIYEEEVPEEAGFDVSIHFRDPSIDEYYYCFKEEMGHLIYHRFMEEDYRNLVI